jgi:hypothetical protein
MPVWLIDETLPSRGSLHVGDAADTNTMTAKGVSP